jgi:hypothetical protein
MVADDGRTATTTLLQPNALTFHPASFTFSAPASNSGPVLVLVDGVSFSVIAGESLLIARVDIKPGSDTNSINAGSRGTIPVALLSLPGFDAPDEVDAASLTFGRTGTEPSLAFCSPGAEDVNGDARPDLKCHFNARDAGFQGGDAQGILEGRTRDARAIRGMDTVRIIIR